MIGALLTILSVSFLGWASPLDAKTTAERVVVAGSGEVTVSWSARAASEGLAFRLYRSSINGVVTLLAETPTDVGSRTYRVSDRLRPGEMVVYRLFVVADLHEIELAVMVRIDAETCDEGVVATPSQTLRAVALRSSLVVPTDQLQLENPHHAVGRAGSRPPPEPPVPKRILAATAT